MSTFIWGPLFWNMMTDLAIKMDYHHNTDTDTHIYTQIWRIFKFMLPCKWCRQSYTKFIKDDPPCKPYRRWIWDLRNKVNIKLQKPIFEWEKFERRCHVYTAFSQPSTWWDIQFILAMNYTPTKKKKYYKQWYKLLPTILKLLHYDFPCFNNVSNTAFISRFTLLRWLASNHSPALPMEYVARKYSHAIAHNTLEELSQLCGPLIIRCQLHDKTKRR